MTALDLISQVLDLSRVCDVAAGLKTIIYRSLSRSFGLSGFLVDETNQMNQIS
jgi:hypothetical protein